MLDQLPTRLQPKAKSQLHEIYRSETKAIAEQELQTFVTQYEDKYPKAVASLLRGRERMLTFYAFPAAHWQSIRSTNAIESAFATVRLRQRVTKGAGGRNSSPSGRHHRAEGDTAELLITVVICAMALAHSKLTAQGQVSVPAKVRQRLGVGPGSVLEWEEDGDHIVVRKAGRYSSEEIHRALFSKTPQSHTTEEMKAGIRQHIKKRHAGR